VGVCVGNRKIVNDASMSLHEGELVALMGRNGSGKTTLLRAMMGFARERDGRIEVGGSIVPAGESAPDGIAYVPQRASTLFFCETLREELEFTARKRNV